MRSPRAEPRARLFCFPFAGGGASAYRQWAAGLPPALEVLAIQLPGRENRIREAPLTSIEAIVAAVLPELTPALDLPFAFFGHSMGSIIATDVARVLAQQGGPLPRQLVVSAHPSPRWQDLRPPLRALPDRDLVTAIDQRYGGVPAEVAEHAELMELLLPMLRADVTALETYRPQPCPPLPCPIAAFGGSEDPEARRDQLEEWRHETTGAFRVRIFPGDHFFINPRRPEVLADLTATLAPLLAPARPAEIP